MIYLIYATKAADFYSSTDLAAGSVLIGRIVSINGYGGGYWSFHGDTQKYGWCLCERENPIDRNG